MYPKDRQHLQDIYASDKTETDDFTPQVSEQVIQDRQRELKNQTLKGIILGSVILVLSLALVVVTVSKYINPDLQEEHAEAIAHEYIPRYSLPTESQWVIDFSHEFSNPEWNGEGDRPFNTEWLKRAAFNIILAEQAYGLMKHDEAAEFYENALLILPELEGVKIPLGMTYFKLERFEEALKLLEDVPEEDLSPEILNNLGAACLHAASYERAETYLVKSIKDKPSYAEPQKNLALLYQEQGREDEAIAAYEKYIDLRPADINAQHKFALYLTQLERWEMAADVLHRLTQVITDVPDLFYLLAQVETKNGNSELAIAAMKRGAKLSDPKAALLHMDSDDFDTLRGSKGFQSIMQDLKQGTN